MSKERLAETRFRRRIPSSFPRTLSITLLLTCIGFWYTSSIGAGALWGDEAQYAVASQSILGGNPFVNIVHMFAPFGKYVIGLSQLVFGTTPFGARFGIVLVSLSTLFAVYLVTCQIQGQTAGILSVIALASVPLFATHSTSAMLDIPLVAGVTLISAASLLEAEAPGTKWRDALVGVSIIIASASKAYGFVYVLGPSLAYIIVRWKTQKIKLPIVRVGIAVVVSFIVIFSPFMFTAPPDYYSGVELPTFATYIFDLPVVGGVIYAFGSSFYFNVFAGHGGSTPPSVLSTIAWIVEGGPFVVFGVFASVGAYALPKRWRVDPWWVPGMLILPPMFIFTLILPKGFARFALPIFPVAIIVASLVSCRILQDVSFGEFTRVLVVVGIFITAISPAGVIVFGDQNLSADSQYDDVAEYLSSKEGDVTVMTDDRHELMWYVGDRYTEEYYRYLNSSIVRDYETRDGHIRLIGTPQSGDLLEQARKNGVDYITLTERSEYFEEIRDAPGTEVVYTSSGYITGETGTHEVSVWRLGNQSSSDAPSPVNDPHY